MTATVVIIPSDEQYQQADESEQRVRVTIHVDAVILNADAAIHKARTWLVENVSPLLGVAEPELVVNERLFWRFEIMLGVPNHVQPGSGSFYRVGQLRLDGATGVVEDAEALVTELRVHVASVDS